MSWIAGFNDDAFSGIAERRQDERPDARRPRAEQLADTRRLATVPRPSTYGRPSGLIDLSRAPSAMEQLAAGWRK